MVMRLLKVELLFLRRLAAFSISIFSKEPLVKCLMTPGVTAVFPRVLEASQRNRLYMRLGGNGDTLIKAIRILRLDPTDLRCVHYPVLASVT